MASCPPAYAESLQSQAESMFTGMANVTAPQAFKGQTMNTYTAGSMFVRVPNKTYQLLAAQAPYLRAGNGCSGIDAFAGSFSHISAEGFKDMLKGITSALPGVLFQLAIKSVEPLLGDTMEWFNSIATMVNRANISSCEAAKMAVYEGYQMLGMATAKNCEQIAWLTGKASDGAAAREYCKNTGNVDTVMASANASADPNIKELPPFRGNLVWQSLKKMPHLDDSDREVIMSVTGTTIYPSDIHRRLQPSRLAGPGRPENLHLALRRRRALRGQQDPAAELRRRHDGLPEPNLFLPRLHLHESAGGGHHGLPGGQDQRWQPVAHGDRDQLRQQRAGAGLPHPGGGGTVNNSAISESLRAQFNDYVAVEFVHAMMSRMVNEAMNAGLQNAKLLPPQTEQLRNHIDLARLFIQQLNADRQVAAQKAQVATTIIQQVAQLERDLRASMPQQVRDLLAYSALR
jgi:conjugative transfer pilus assembly protein TraH